jgi:CRISPR-associated endonuclease/helicase Cas3
MNDQPPAAQLHYAHTLPGRPPSDWEPLECHLDRVARRAAEFASVFGASEVGYLAGLWHDLGKYRRAFQEYLAASRTASELWEDGAVIRVDHSTAGAIHALRTLGRPLGYVVAYLIAGHHAGLPDAEGGEASLRARLNRLEILNEVLLSSPPPRVLAAPPRTPTSSPPSKVPRHFHLWIRMLFSALVDADFLETEAFLNPVRAQARAAPSDLTGLGVLLREHLATKQRAASGPMASLRAEVLASCRDRASNSPGIFSLTVPTGGGKTLSSLAFAIDHAAVHGMRRIIYVIPYTSILEQTADVFRGIFGPSAVIEHHSNLAPERDDELTRLASENWDAPIIVTTV